jgi:phospholipid/cholesterol/gamma-HCH transport system substrate-binding protein
MENKSHAMAAGSFVLCLLALLIGLTLWLTRDRNDYREFEMTTEEAISGLQNQATVRYKGVAVGKVTLITFDDLNKGQVLIRIAVDSKAPVTPTGTYGTLGYQGVTGLAYVQLDDLVPPLKEALPRGESDIPRLLMKASQLNVLADQGMNILTRVDEATARINQLLDDANQERFSQLLENLAQAAGNVSATTRAINTTLHDKVAPAVQEFPALAEDARKAMQALTQAGTEAAHLVRDVHQMTQAAQQPGGALEQVVNSAQSMARAAERFDRSTLPSINQAADDVSTAARQLGGAASSFGANPQALIFGSPNVPGPGEPGFVAPASGR